MQRSFRNLGSQTFDVAIVGGGITGACIARDAARRGLSVALVDKGDFSCGTSSGSTKLVHGGLRYLKSMEFSLIRESLRERRVWERIAPHMVYPMPFILTADEAGRRIARVIEAGRGYAVVPWQMAIVAKLLRLLPNRVFDAALAGRGRKPRGTGL